MVVHDVAKLRHRYVTSGAFRLDVVSVVPTDVVFFVSYESPLVIARLNRVLRIRPTSQQLAPLLSRSPF